MPIVAMYPKMPRVCLVINGGLTSAKITPLIGELKVKAISSKPEPDFSLQEPDTTTLTQPTLITPFTLEEVEQRAEAELEVIIHKKGLGKECISCQGNIAKVVKDPPDN
jgi:hypothetical protein